MDGIDGSGGDNERFRAIFEHAPLMIDEFDENGRCLLWNRQCEHNLGYTREEIESCDDPLTLFYPDPAMQRRVLESITRADGMFREYQVRAKGGEIRIQKWADFRLPTGSLISVGIDITDVRTYEKQLRAAAKMQALGQLTGGIAHEFNNLLTIIAANADLAERRLHTGDDIHNHLEAIRSTADRGARLVKKLLAFGRQEHLHLTSLDLSEKLAGILATLRGMLPEQIDLRSDFADKVMVAADPGVVAQIAVTLTSNAADSITDAGAITLTTRTVELRGKDATVLGLEDGTYGCLSVSDTGSGMSDETRARIFEPFFSTKPPGEAAGLGLPMVYGLARQHGGGVRLTSKVGEGTTVHVYLPEGGHVERPRPPTPASLLEGTERILVVEDELALLSSARALLTECGYRVVGTTNGDRALAILKSSSTPFDLVVADLMVASQPGLHLVTAARAAGVESAFLFTTGNPVAATSPRDDGRLLEKPWNAEELLHAVRAALDGDRKRHEPPTPE